MTVGIIRQGKVLNRHRRARRWLILLSPWGWPPADLKQLPGIYAITQKEGKWRFSVDVSAMDAVMKALAPMGIKSLTAEPPTLEELFIRHYGDKREGRELN